MTQAKCSCGFEGDFPGYSERDIKPGIVEIGIECPDCKKWFHSFYQNEKLKELQTRAETTGRNSYVLKYKRKFKQVQTALREKYGVDAPQIEANENN